MRGSQKCRSGKAARVEFARRAPRQTVIFGKKPLLNSAAVMIVNQSADLLLT